MQRLTIDEVIAHCKRRVERMESFSSRENCESWSIDTQYAKEYWEHRQVAEWLEELKIYKECNISKTNFSMGYAKAIDEFAYKCKEHLLCRTFGLHPNNIDEIAEQMKGGGE